MATEAWPRITRAAPGPAGQAVPVLSRRRVQPACPNGLVHRFFDPAFILPFVTSHS